MSTNIKVNKENPYNISTRSVLYNLEPIGLETALVESLKSYIGRLAKIHNLRLSDFVKHILSEEIADPSLNRVQLFYKRISGWSTYGKYSDDCINALEELTTRENLNELTLFNWSGIFHSRILSADLKWCAKCFEEWRLSQIEVYEPLLWSLSSVRICPIHKISLSIVCPHCKKRPKSFSSRYIPGYCTSCMGWLGSLQIDSFLGDLTTEEKDYLLFQASELGHLMKNNNFEGETIKTQDLKKLINIIINVGANGSPTKFGKIIGKTKRTIFTWLSGENYPNIESLLIICKKYNLSLFDIATYNLNIDIIKKNKSLAKEIYIPKKLSNVGITHSQEFLDNIKRQLEDICENEHPPPSLSATKIRLGYRGIESKFPENAKVIKNNYNKYIEQKKKNYSEKLNEVCNEVIAITIYLHNVGIYPSRRVVEENMKKPGYFRVPKVTKAWKKTLRTLT